MLEIDMAEATRLTRQGRLKEAMALLRGGEPRTPQPTEDVAVPGRLLGLRMPAMLRGLAARLGQPVGTPRPGPMPGQGSEPVPAGARFETRSFTNVAGGRSYKLFVPSGARGQALPLVVMLHGCTQSPDDFAAAEAIEVTSISHLSFNIFSSQKKIVLVFFSWLSLLSPTPIHPRPSWRVS